MDARDSVFGGDASVGGRGGEGRECKYKIADERVALVLGVEDVCIGKKERVHEGIERLYFKGNRRTKEETEIK